MVSDLCGHLRPDVIALTDAFDVSDRVLNSALGRSDGQFCPSCADVRATRGRGCAWADSLAGGGRGRLRDKHEGWRERYYRTPPVRA